jgi:nicotinate-nucleotide--dimethylbenzimidazole phosphoribosyltransferase
MNPPYEISPRDASAEAAMKDRMFLQALQPQLADVNIYQIAGIQGTTHPKLQNPTLLLFGSVHGFTVEHFPEIHIQQENLVSNILNKESAVNKNLNGTIQLKLVDAGLHGAYRNYLNFWLYLDELMELPGHWEGSRNVTTERAMASKDVKKAMKEGARLVDKYHQKGSNCLILSAVGKSSWFSVQLLAALYRQQGLKGLITSLHLMEQFPNQQIDAKRLLRKLRLAFKRNPITHDALTQIGLYGGPDIAMLVGAILKAASLKITIVADGQAAVIATLLAEQFHPNAPQYVIIADKLPPAFVNPYLMEWSKVPVFTRSLRFYDGTAGAWAVHHLQNRLNQLR